MEYKHIDDYYPVPVEGQNTIDQAVQGQIGFNRAVLDQIRTSAFVEEHQRNRDLILLRSRNLGGLNVDFHNTRLRVDNGELDKEVITPSAIEMQNRAILRTQDEQSFAGYTESEYLYWVNDYENRLQQLVEASHLPTRVSPVFETVSIQRYVLDHVGDLTYGHVIFNDREVTNRLRIKPRQEDPVFLTFTPDKVLATTYFSTVLGERSYEDLESVGIRASFDNTTERAELSLSADQMTFQLRLGKI